MSRYKRVYTGKFRVGDRIYLNDTRNIHHGGMGIVRSINRNPKANPYEVLLDGDRYAFFYNETELSKTPVLQ